MSSERPMYAMMEQSLGPPSIQIVGYDRGERDDALEEGLNKYWLWMEREPRMGRMVGAVLEVEAIVKYHEYFGIRHSHNLIHASPVKHETVLAARRFAADPIAFLADCNLGGLPISPEATPLIADWLDEAGDERGAAVREYAFQRGIQQRC